MIPVPYSNKSRLCELTIGSKSVSLELFIDLLAKILMNWSLSLLNFEFLLQDISNCNPPLPNTITWWLQYRKYEMVVLRYH